VTKEISNEMPDETKIRGQSFLPGKPYSAPQITQPGIVKRIGPSYALHRRDRAKKEEPKVFIVLPYACREKKT